MKPGPMEPRRMYKNMVMSRIQQQKEKVIFGSRHNHGSRESGILDKNIQNILFYLCTRYKESELLTKIMTSSIQPSGCYQEGQCLWKQSTNKH